MKYLTSTLTATKISGVAEEYDFDWTTEVQTQDYLQATPNARTVSTYLNLLTTTATISSTRTVIIEIVIIRFVAILSQSISKVSNVNANTADWGIGRHYLRAIPLNVFTLLSTYPSLSCSTSLVCWIVSRCLCRSASVLAPTASVSFASAWLAFSR